MKLMSLINDIPSRTVQANVTDSGANQHMTISTANMFGIIDITDLNLTVGHPNEYYDLHVNKIVETNSENGSLYMFDSPSPISSNFQTIGSNFVSETLRKSDQLHQTFEKISIAMTRKLGDMIELPKSQPKRTYNEDLECEIVMVKMPKCMAWLDDEPIGNLDKMEDKVDNLSLQCTPQVLPSIELYTLPVTHPKDVEGTIGIPLEVEPLDHMKLEDLGLNTNTHDLFLSSKRFPSVGEPKPQLLPNFSPLDVHLGDKRGTDLPINPYSPGSFRMKVIFDEKKLGSRKAHLLEDKQILSVGVFDKVFSIWKAFGGNTRDLGSFKEETDKTTNLHQHISGLCSQRLETASQDTRDAIAFHPTTASQDLATAPCVRSEKIYNHAKDVDVMASHVIGDAVVKGVVKLLVDVPYDNHNNPSDQAVDVFQSDLQFTKDSHVSPCDICHKAKQTREPFTLSDHKTTVIGELVHVDLWGPYKVISKDGCKSSSSFLNGKSLLELVYGVKPKLSHLRSFFCLCYSSMLNNSHKFSARDIEFYENVFSFKMNYCLQPVEENHDDNINSLNFFDEKHFDDQTSFRPNDDGRVNFASNHESNVFPCSKSTQTSDECDDNIATSMVQPDLSRSGRNSKLPAKFNDYVVGSSRKYGLEKYVTYSNLSKTNYCFSTTLNKSSEPTIYAEAIKNPNWIEVTNNEIEALNRNNTWTICDLSPRRKVVESKCLWKIKKSDKVFIALLVYVDHIVITSNDLAKIEKFYMFLKSKCQIKDVGKLKYFLAIEVLDNIEGSCLSHRKYCLELLHEYGLLRLLNMLLLRLLENHIPLNLIETA
ncbi:ribonuclease H-like domain-containing protein [Tanacetum coccineum]|uniref:Ribonuclease H-like domain-containing protein n=1 Tax=Tanacetum coccineum TaxID=301880 RepID=A0ABQ5FCY5_9ASTR